MEDQEQPCLQRMKDSTGKQRVLTNERDEKAQSQNPECLLHIPPPHTTMPIVRLL